MSTPPEPAVLPDSPSPEPSPPSRGRGVFLIAGGLATLWISGLVILALTTANPVTLNRKQILRSDVVVTATRETRDSAILVVSKEWKHGKELGKISVANLDEAQMPAGQEFLVPLQQVGKERFFITETTLPNQAPLIYPATPEAKTHLEELLQTQ